jgi:predicted TIM-barrel fold metal-dependent hydrolase
MLLCDVHTHVGVDLGFYLRGWWPYAATVQDLLDHMDANGIDLAVCMPFALPSAFDPYAFAQSHRIRLMPGRYPFDHENELLAVEIERLDQQKRLRQFGMFDPVREVALQVLKLEALADAGRIAGLKTQATILESPIRALLTSPGCAFIEMATRRDLPVLIHTSIAPHDRWSQVADCLEVAEAFPRVRFNLAHSLRFHLPSLKRAASLPNVWVDCAAHLAHCALALDNSTAIAVPAERLQVDYAKPSHVLEAIHSLLPGRYLWGSDTPFHSWVDDGMKLLFGYVEEARVLHQLSADVKFDVASRSPQIWLSGDLCGNDTK